MIRGDRLTLRAITRDDLPRYVSWLNDPEVTKHLGHIPPFNLDDETDWFERQRKDDSVYHLAIDTPDGVHIGSVSLMNIDARNQKAELGIVIGLKSDWGKGFGTEAINIMLDYGFYTLNLNRIYLRVDTEHFAGITCYQRCGFTQEGELRHDTFREGQFHNVYLMSILREEYEKRIK
ncbi:MAG: GNAT family protein [Chloroflexota bacterium]